MSAVRSTSGLQSAGLFVRRYADWIMGFVVLGLIVTMVTPIAPALLDVLVALNLATSVLLLLVTMNGKSASELSTFPTILLFTTLFRLALNVASTRLILTNGEAGHIIKSFGEYVGGDNLAVGLVVFLILIIIQFVVITKGSGRISEVAARFVLDAMPGKQMSIDADLNSGVIDSTEAQRRRTAIASEAEFYGAMDGASKFVRGDAIAGLIITALNLVCGIAMGAYSGLAIEDAARRYSMLTIGDGLVSQIPALFISTAAAILVTRNTSDESLGTDLMSQIGGRPKATGIAAGVIFVLGLLPGMPAIPFFVLATVLAALWRSSLRAERARAAESQVEASARTAQTETQRAREDDHATELAPVDRVSLEIGYRLIPLVQDKSGAGILDHISQLRKRLGTKEGVVLPPVRVKDNIRLAPNGYRVLLGGQEIARGEIEPGLFLAMDSGTASGKVKGKQTVDPAFGLPAWWVSESVRDEAEVLGYTVIDPTSVLVTHVSETLRSSLGDLLSRDDVKQMLEHVKKVAPAVVEELVPDKMSYGDVQRVLRNLLRDGVSVRNLPAILEVLADHVAKTKDPEALTELVRQRLGRALCEAHSDRDGTLHAVTLDPEIENRLAAAVGMNKDAEAAAVNPAWLQRLMEKTGGAVAQATKGGKDVVLLVRSNVRRFVNELARASLPKVAVLSYNEVVPARAVETAAVVRMEE